MKRLAICEAAKPLEMERGRKLDANCSRLQSQLSAVKEQLVAAEAILVETEAIIRHLEQHTDVGLKARVERCLHGYVN